MPPTNWVPPRLLDVPRNRREKSLMSLEHGPCVSDSPMSGHFILFCVGVCQAEPETRILAQVDDIGGNPTSRGGRTWTRKESSRCSQASYTEGHQSVIPLESSTEQCGTCTPEFSTLRETGSRGSYPVTYQHLLSLAGGHWLGDIISLTLLAYCMHE